MFHFLSVISFKPSQIERLNRRNSPRSTGWAVGGVSLVQCGLLSCRRQCRLAHSRLLPKSSCLAAPIIASINQKLHRNGWQLQQNTGSNCNCACGCVMCVCVAVGLPHAIAAVCKCACWMHQSARCCLTCPRHAASSSGTSPVFMSFIQREQ